MHCSSDRRCSRSRGLVRDGAKFKVVGTSKHPQKHSVDAVPRDGPSEAIRCRIVLQHERHVLGIHERVIDRDEVDAIRFVERAGTFASSPGFANPEGVLPGLADAAPVFDVTSIPAYSDHWASSVLEAAL